MKIGIPVWNKWVSPVFDTANKLIVIEVHDNKETSRNEELMPQGAFHQRTKRVAELGIEVLICNAISSPCARMLSLTGAELIPWRSGPVEEIIQAYLGGTLGHPRFLIPGCPMDPSNGRWRGSGGIKRHRRRRDK
jgi:predicted Fe-Mo cluster-binding NifX family protein